MKPKLVQELLDLSRDNYQKIAQDFNVTRKKALWPEIYRWTKGLKDGDQILDLGCGNGRLLEALKDKKIGYLGVDSSDALIDLARQNYPEKNFIVADILKLEDIPGQSFDYIFCLAVLHHIPGQDLQIAALKQMIEKLKPGGQIIISVWNLWNSAKYRRLLFKNFCFNMFRKQKMPWRELIFSWKNQRGEKTSQRYYHAFTNWELRKIIKGLGVKLKIDKIYKDKFNYWLILRKEE